MAKKSSLIPTLLAGAGIVALGMIAKNALSGSDSGGTFQLGGQQEPEPVYSILGEQVDNQVNDVASANALITENTDMGGGDERFTNPHDNPSIVERSVDVPESLYTNYATAQETQNNDFFSQHPVAGWSLIGASFIPSWFSKQGTKLGEKLIPPKKTTDTVVDSVLKQGDNVVKPTYKAVGGDIAESALKVGAKKGLKTGATIGLKSLPVFGWGSGVFFDMSQGVSFPRSAIRNTAGDLAGGVAGVAGAVAGPVGAFAGGIGGQVGGEIGTDKLMESLGYQSTKGMIKTKEFRDKGLNPDTASSFFNPNTGLLMSPLDGVMNNDFSNIMFAGSKGQTGTGMNARSMLAEANSARASYNPVNTPKSSGATAGFSSGVSRTSSTRTGSTANMTSKILGVSGRDYTQSGMPSSKANGVGGTSYSTSRINTGTPRFSSTGIANTSSTSSARASALNQAKKASSRTSRGSDGRTRSSRGARNRASYNKRKGR